MKINEIHDYHGSVFSQLVLYPAFKSLNKAPPPLGLGSGYGHYFLNADRHFFIKYSRKVSRPWPFRFSPPEINALVMAQLLTPHPIWILLVCGKRTICAVTLSEASQLINIKMGGAAQHLKVDAVPNSSLHVTGKLGKTKKTIPHNRFPKALFAPEEKIKGF
jgi:hypothetical protein